MASEGERRPDWLGKGTGLLVFLTGIGMLIAVFIWINSLGISEELAGKNWDAQAIVLGLDVLKRLGGGLIASWVAASGARLYAAASMSPRRSE